MTTAATVIERVRRDLLSGIAEQVNRLDVTMTASGTEIQLTYDLRGLAAGVTLEVDQELMYVWGDPNLSTRTATVERGWMATTPAAHTQGALVTIAPRYPRGALFDDLNRELSSLATPSNGLYRMLTVDLSYSGNGYDLPANFPAEFIDVHEIRQEMTSLDWQPVAEYELVRNQVLTDFPTGNVLRLPALWSGRLRIQYKARFTELLDVDDDLTDVAGVPKEYEDIVELGMMLRRCAPREIARNDTRAQGDSRRAAEVGAGAVQRSWQGIAALRERRIAEEAAALVHLYPSRYRR